MFKIFYLRDGTGTYLPYLPSIVPVLLEDVLGTTSTVPGVLQIQILENK